MPKKEPTPAKRGRPPKMQANEETFGEIQKLAAMMATKEEAGAWFDVCRDTFAAFLNKHPEAKQAWEFGQGKGKISLRRNQFKLSETNATMGIWLGKQLLGQKDVIEQRIFLKRLDQMTDEEIAYVLGDTEAAELDEIARDRAAKSPGRVSKAAH